MPHDCSTNGWRDLFLLNYCPNAVSQEKATDLCQWCFINLTLSKLRIRHKGSGISIVLPTNMLCLFLCITTLGSMTQVRFSLCIHLTAFYTMNMAMMSLLRHCQRSLEGFAKSWWHNPLLTQWQAPEPLATAIDWVTPLSTHFLMNSWNTVSLWCCNRCPSSAVMLSWSCLTVIHAALSSSKSNSN